jgi:site-specific recombinase XerD
MDYLTQFTDMLQLRGLQPHTVKAYKTYVCAYLSYLSTTLNKLPEDATWQDMRDFIKYIQQVRCLSDRTINACISQLRFFTIYVLHQSWDPTQLPFRRFDTYLPFVPTQDEVRIFIESIDDLKLKTIVALMYSAGLRVGEVCNLRYEDISRKTMRIHIRHGKNRSDRWAILSSVALDLLTGYWFEYGRPRGYLFPSPMKTGKPVHTFWVNYKIHEQERRLGWEERFTPHTFRHAFGTHLYENGADLLTIKTLLGHKSLSSTTIYVHLSAASTRVCVSPLDTLLANHD